MGRIAGIDSVVMNDQSISAILLIYSLESFRYIFPAEAYRHKKKEQRLAPTFVNLKSNTMKNTVQRYALLVTLQIIQEKKYVL